MKKTVFIGNIKIKDREFKQKKVQFDVDNWSSARFWLPTEEAEQLQVLEKELKESERIPEFIISVFSDGPLTQKIAGYLLTVILKEVKSSTEEWEFVCEVTHYSTAERVN